MVFCFFRVIIIINQEWITNLHLFQFTAKLFVAVSSCLVCLVCSCAVGLVSLRRVRITRSLTVTVLVAIQSSNDTGSRRSTGLHWRFYVRKGLQHETSFEMCTCLWQCLFVFGRPELNLCGWMGDSILLLTLSAKKSGSSRWTWPEQKSVASSVHV